MATPYSEVYTAFLRRISDTDLLQLSQEELSSVLKSFLKGAITQFSKCKQDLSLRDDNLEQFYIDLTDREIEILGALMVVEWLRPTINASYLLKQTLSTKDFKIYSQANHLDELIKLKKEAEEDAERMIMEYLYDNWLEETL
jgi:hypothetical protein